MKKIIKKTKKLKSKTKVSVAVPTVTVVSTTPTTNQIEQLIVDPRLGRRYQEDVRSLDFPVCALLPRQAYKKPRTKLWECNQVLNQGSEGSCVGHGFAHELIARPYPIKKITHLEAVKIYKKAQELDDWPGSSYSGTSVLAGAKATLALYPGTMESYRWANSLSDIIATIGYHGPIVVGINWYMGMYTPDAQGYIRITGSIAGGHCLLAIGVDIVKNHIVLRNSWGPSFGMKGDCYISFLDFERLLAENGDCCVPVHRGYWRKRLV